MGGSHVLLKGTLDPLPSLGYGGRCWFWIPDWSGQGLGWNLRHQPPKWTLCPGLPVPRLSACLSSAPACLPACGRKLW